MLVESQNNDAELQEVLWQEKGLKLTKVSIPEDAVLRHQHTDSMTVHHAAIPVADFSVPTQFGTARRQGNSKVGLTTFRVAKDQARQ